MITTVPLIPTIPDPRFILCIRLAAMHMLLETGLKRITVDIDELLMHARIIYDHPELR